MRSRRERRHGAAAGTGLAAASVGGRGGGRTEEEGGSSAVVGSGGGIVVAVGAPATFVAVEFAPSFSEVAAFVFPERASRSMVSLSGREKREFHARTEGEGDQEKTSARRKLKPICSAGI